MKSFIEQARFYAGYHQKPATLYTHLIGIPLIIFSLMILMGFVQIKMPTVFSITFATIGTLVLLAYYFMLNWRLALTITPILALLLWLSTFFSHSGPTKTGIWVFFICFVAGWTLQLAGHAMEGKKPALVDNLWQALIAPLFLIAELYFMMNWMSALKAQIHDNGDTI